MPILKDSCSKKKNHSPRAKKKKKERKIARMACFRVSTAFWRVLALSTSLCASVTNYALVFSIAPQMARTFGVQEKDVGLVGGVLTGRETSPIRQRCVQTVSLRILIM